ncbi:MAG: hypothetical protein JNK82_40840 [Myxococcaceae bacterium]|nr:hypothetical protein [Myxococcaceae bacterium]
MWRALFSAVLVVVVVGCVSNVAVRPAPPQPLYFALELTEGGKRIGAPKLLGFSGKRVIAERRSPGMTDPDYRIVLEPREEGAGYQLDLRLKLPSGERRGGVTLLHGEERSVSLGDGTEAKVMLMRVDSDEFRALISTPNPGGRGQI